MIEEIKNNMNKDKYLSKFACKNSDAIRFIDEENDIRPPYLRDADRIIYSLSYTRYIDKTQVFSNTTNDHISKRMTHVQMVSKVARTIGRALNLNEDLIEAAALGHDIGHVPFGHEGEFILNKISLENNCGYFNHNIQSIREFMTLENNGKGLNLTLQVLDAIMCHNGEIEQKEYKPIKKTKEEFMQEYENAYVDKTQNKKMIPMTLEGCVVRISDIIAYLGRDIEDAIRLGMLTIDDVPTNIKNVLGSTNKEIINTLIMDIITNSYDKGYILLSDNVYEALSELKKFNYEHIYSKAHDEKTLNYWEECFRKVFNYNLENIDNKDSVIYKDYLSKMSSDYLNKTSNERKVIDFIAGMTDDYLINCRKAIDNLDVL